MDRKFMKRASKTPVQVRPVAASICAQNGTRRPPSGSNALLRLSRRWPATGCAAVSLSCSLHLMRSAILTSTGSPADQCEGGSGRKQPTVLHRLCGPAARGSRGTDVSVGSEPRFQWKVRCQDLRVPVVAQRLPAPHAAPDCVEAPRADEVRVKCCLGTQGAAQRPYINAFKALR